VAAEVIIIMGPQGSGKGTQAQILCDRLNLVNLSSGALLRASNDPVILERIGQGQLARSEDVKRVMQEAIEALEPEQGILIDAFPRMLNEAQWLVELLNKLERQVGHVILLVVPSDESVHRLRIRADKDGRQDDSMQGIMRRLELFEQETVPVLNFWRQQGLLQEVDGLGTVEEVATRIQKVVGL
jgi:adenylate kinase